MTFVDGDDVTTTITRFGPTTTIEVSMAFPDRSAIPLLGSWRKGRAHDVTFAIIHQGKVVMNRKPFYGPGIYRIPSGGANRGENIESAVIRESMEETGLEVSIFGFPTIIEADLSIPQDMDVPEAGETIPWRSYLFTCIAHSGDITGFLDRREIEDVKLFTLDEVRVMQDRLRETGWSGLAYRARLQEELIPTMERMLASL